MTTHAGSESAVERARTILGLNTAYFTSKVLHSAVELGIFDYLAKGPATVENTCAALEITHPLAVEYLEVLVHLGLIERCEDGRFVNSAIAADLLVQGGQTYVGGTIGQHSRMHYHTWSKLTEALRDGQSKSGMTAHGPDAYPKHYEDLDRARQVMNHFDVFSGFTADELARHIDWSRFSSFVDIGGGRGNVATKLVNAFPNLSGGVFDLPALRPLFNELAATRGVTDRVTFHGGDFFADALPETDAFIIGHVLPDWPEENRQELVDRMFAALKPGGMVIIYDTMIGTEAQDLPALLQRLNHSLVRGDSSSFTVEQCRGYLEKAGFTFEKAMAADTLLDDWFVIATKSSRT